jgi:nitrite reductase/ring-hydroxylating ferredoxin subunit
MDYIFEEQSFPEIEKDGKIYANVCKSSDVFEGKGKQIKFPEDLDMQVALFRMDGVVYALQNICPHRHADKIYDGIVRDMTVICPLHGWTYRIDTGENVINQQGVKSLIKYDAFEENGQVWVEKPKNDVIPKWRK